jgi:hypothetical protein
MALVRRSAGRRRRDTKGGAGQSDGGHVYRTASPGIDWLAQASSPGRQRFPQRYPHDFRLLLDLDQCAEISSVARPAWTARMAGTLVARGLPERTFTTAGPVRMLPNFTSEPSGHSGAGIDGGTGASKGSSSRSRLLRIVIKSSANATRPTVTVRVASSHSICRVHTATHPRSIPTFPIPSFIFCPRSHNERCIVATSLTEGFDPDQQVHLVARETSTSSRRCLSPLIGSLVGRPPPSENTSR